MIEKWNGEYAYNEEYSTPFKNRLITFQIEWNIEEGVIKGICIDDKIFAPFDAPAIIEGFIEGEMISFIKTYPCFLSWNEETNKPLILTDVPSQNIHYTGWLVDDHYEGDWQCTGDYKDDNGHTEYVIFMQGTWIIRKS